MKKLTIAIVASLSLWAATNAFANDVTLSNTEQSQLDDIVTMLKGNPELIPNLHQGIKGYITQQTQIDQVLVQNHDYLYNNPKHPQFGAVNPKLTIINFTDYSCPFCKKLDPVLHQAALSYPDVRVVNVLVPLIEMRNPLSDKNSAAFAINVWNQDRDKFFDVNETLIKKPSAHDNRSVTNVAKKFNTEASLKSSEETQKIIEKNYQLFNELGLRGTPAMVIGDQIVPGYVPMEELKKLIDNALAS
ncbi:DsbA family protein [Enterovibrio sp. ZSDZ35]|uniref:DsbA family protein n=1 Tax=Enterovibrio qingdaonensis TaxID=2899818 RepID=A0ABT5QQR8_9GAMM|nr:DsbA family protein [Enterovibrio sp. ZSDZ35]MDD1783317.1 DsbA family protein [Enterovibrio sp. ZSDZ35]